MLFLVKKYNCNTRITEEKDVKYYYFTIDYIIPIIIPNYFNLKCLTRFGRDEYTMGGGRYIRLNKAYTIQDITNTYYIGYKYNIYDIRTIQKFNLEITETYISNVCKHGFVEVLEYLKKRGLLLEYHETAIDNASANCHINILEWWKHSGLPLKYSERILTMASQNDNIKVLEW